MKRLLSLILAALMLFSAAAFAEETELSVEFDVATEAEAALPLEDAEAVEAAGGEAEAAPMEDVWLEGDDSLAEANTVALPDFHYDGSRYVTFTKVEGATQYLIGNDTKGGLFHLYDYSYMYEINGDTYKVDLKAYMNEVQAKSGAYKVTVYAYVGSYYAVAQSSVTYNYINDMPSLEKPEIWWEGTTLRYTVPEHATYLNCMVYIYRPDGIMIDSIGFNGLPTPYDYDISKQVTVLKDCLYLGSIFFNGTGYRNVEAETDMMTGEELLSGKARLTGSIPSLHPGNNVFEVGKLVQYTPTFSGASASLTKGDLIESWQTSADASAWTEVGSHSTYTIKEADDGKYFRLTVTAEGYEGQLISPVYRIGSSSETVEYAINITGGTASKTKAKAGETVTITADPPKYDFHTFAYWFSTEGTNLKDYKSATTSFVMPAFDITIWAMYNTETLDTFYVYVTQPEPGQLPASPTVKDTEYSVDHYRWLNMNTGTDMAEGETFQAGETYQIRVWLKTQKPVADGKLTGYVNGLTDIVNNCSRSKGMAHVAAMFVIPEDAAPPAPDSPQPPEVISPEHPQNAIPLDYALMGKDDETDAAGASFALLQAKATSGKKSIKLSWKAVPGATVYAVYASPCGAGNNFNFIDGTSATSFKLTGLVKGTYYKAIVMAVDGSDKALAVSQTIHAATTGGKVGNHTKVAMGKTKLTLAAGKTKKVKATLKRGSKKVKIHRKLTWESGDVRVATVDQSGNITAVAPGKCTVYAYAQNGVTGKCVVTVK